MENLAFNEENVIRDFKPKWIKWDEDSFRADRTVGRMTPRQRSLYRTLIIESYYCGTRPYLPDNDSELWLLADADSLQEWIDAKASILSKFEHTEDNDGKPLLFNKRVIEEWHVLLASLRQKKNASALGVEARLKKSPKEPNGNRAVPKTGTPDAPPEAEVEKESERESEREQEVEIERSDTGEQTTTTRSPSGQIPPRSLSSGKQSDDDNNFLYDYVVEIAKSVNGNASFTGKDRQEIQRIVSEKKPGREDLKTIVEQTVNSMDSFDLNRAGNLIAAQLSGAIGAEKQRKAKAQKEREFEEKMRRHSDRLAEEDRQKYEARLQQIKEDEQFNPEIGI